MSADVTAEQVRALFDYDASAGILIRKTPKGNQLAGTRAGSVERNGYRRVSVGNRNYQEHRVIWLYWYGTWPREELDHIDGDKSNNRIANLRDVPRRINSQNLRRAVSTSESGLLGVSRSRRHVLNPWVACIKVDGKQKHLGYFKSPEEASACYVNAKRELHEGNTL